MLFRSIRAVPNRVVFINFRVLRGKIEVKHGKCKISLVANQQPLHKGKYKGQGIITAIALTMPNYACSISKFDGKLTGY